MKRLFLTLFAFSFFGLFSQNNLNWQNAILHADGSTQVGGVQAFCKKVNCSGSETVLIKFVNNNNYKVRLEWVDGIFVNGTWHYQQNPNPKVLYVDANASLEGTCNEAGKLNLPVSAILQDPGTFQHYGVSGLKVSN